VSDIPYLLTGARMAARLRLERAEVARLRDRLRLERAEVARLRDRLALMERHYKVHMNGYDVHRRWWKWLLDRWEGVA
jgi:hypothetical protein